MHIVNCAVFLVQGTSHNNQLFDGNTSSVPCTGDPPMTSRVPGVTINSNGAISGISGIPCYNLISFLVAVM